jgi:hypothetical protein
MAPKDAALFSATECLRMLLHHSNQEEHTMLRSVRSFAFAFTFAAMSAGFAVPARADSPFATERNKLNQDEAAAKAKGTSAKENGEATEQSGVQKTDQEAASAKAKGKAAETQGGTKAESGKAAAKKSGHAMKTKASNDADAAEARGDVAKEHGKSTAKADKARAKAEARAAKDKANAEKSKL